MALIPKSYYEAYRAVLDREARMTLNKDDERSIERSILSGILSSDELRAEYERLGLLTTKGYDVTRDSAPPPPYNPKGKNLSVPDWLRNVARLWRAGPPPNIDPADLETIANWYQELQTKAVMYRDSLSTTSSQWAALSSAPRDGRVIEVSGPLGHGHFTRQIIYARYEKEHEDHSYVTLGIATKEELCWMAQDGQTLARHFSLETALWRAA